jgi:hypothetical protein
VLLHHSPEAPIPSFKTIDDTSKGLEIWGNYYPLLPSYTETGTHPIPRYVHLGEHNVRNQLQCWQADTKRILEFLK